MSTIVNANHPSIKYLPKQESDVGSEPQPLSFFNYHEYLVDKYQPHNSGSPSQNQDNSPQKASIVVSHFPNPYALRDSELFRSTRVVRIPRRFDISEFLYLIPHFSEYAPGDEPAGIKGEGGIEFVASGEYDGTVFGATSATPLVPTWVSESELKSIVDTINKYLEEAVSPWQRATWLDNVLDFFSATLYSRFFTNNVRDTHMKRKLVELEKYVEEINSTMLSKRNSVLALISPVKSGFLSLDFQIPRP